MMIGTATGAKVPLVAATMAINAPMTFIKLLNTCAMALPNSLSITSMSPENRFKILVVERRKKNERGKGN